MAAVGPEPYKPEAPVLDTWSVLPVIAKVTNRVKFGPLVSPFARRHPALLAKSSSIVDQISEGRLQPGRFCGPLRLGLGMEQVFR